MNGAADLEAAAQSGRALRSRDSAAAAGALHRIRSAGRRYDYARWLAAEPELVDPDSPATAVRDALAIFEQVGAMRSAGEARDKLVRLGASSPAPGQAWDTLTPTEREIVRLLAEGSTNAQIADQRNSSRRTVESHLSRVYQKLNIEGRVKLTVAAIEHFRTPT